MGGKLGVPKIEAPEIDVNIPEILGKVQDAKEVKEFSTGFNKHAKEHSKANKDASDSQIRDDSLSKLKSEGVRSDPVKKVIEDNLGDSVKSTIEDKVKEEADKNEQVQKAPARLKDKAISKAVDTAYGKIVDKVFDALLLGWVKKAKSGEDAPAEEKKEDDEEEE